MTEKTKVLTEAQRNHLKILNTALMRAKQHEDQFMAYLRAEHGAPAGEWALRNLQVGFERVPKPPARKRTGQKSKDTGAAE